MRRTTIHQIEGYIEAVSFTVQALLRRSLPRTVVIQLKKHSNLLENAAQRTQFSESSKHQLEVC